MFAVAQKSRGRRMKKIILLMSINLFVFVFAMEKDEEKKNEVAFGFFSEEDGQEVSQLSLPRGVLAGSSTLRSMYEDLEHEYNFVPMGEGIGVVTPEQFQIYFCSYAPYVQTLLNYTDDTKTQLYYQKQLRKKIKNLNDEQLGLFANVNDYLDVELLLNPAIKIVKGRVLKNCRENGLISANDHLCTFSLMPTIQRKVISYIAKSIENSLKAQHIKHQTTLHDGLITAVDFSPDSKCLASVAWDRSIDLWDLSSGYPFKIFSKTTGIACSVACHPKNQHILSGHNDGTLRVWDVKGERVGIFNGHKNYLVAIACSQDGKHVATASYDQLVKLWDSSNYQCLKIFSGHTNSILSIHFSPDSKILASGSRDKKIILWNCADGSIKKILDNNTSPIASVVFSHDGTLLASGSTKGAVQLWELLVDIVKKKQLLYHLESLTSLAFTPDDAILISGSLDQSINIWDVQTGAVLRTISGAHANGINSVKVNGDGTQMASGSFDGFIKIWTIAATSQMINALTIQEILLFHTLITRYYKERSIKIAINVRDGSSAESIVYATLSDNVKALLKPYVNVITTT